ncbi:MLP-like protein 31 [Hibiscus trionum]|uniref:MLP-like protein 31 n=1 Tax=Hibiscus trionum TaxID=183268 RepID=A0A9W7I1K8_HIBTR|nr:MLP-like protein 31 [Hibiscus trionum]
MASSPPTGKLEFDVEIDATPEQLHHMWAHRPHPRAPHQLRESSRMRSTRRRVREAKTAKQVVEEIDDENKSIRFKILEGDLMEEYKSFVITLQTLPKKEGKGCIAHWTLEYESLRQFFIELTGDMGAHLVKEK